MELLISLSIITFIVLITIFLLTFPATKGWAGEKLVAYKLKKCFPKGTVIFNDLYFHNGKRSCQIDHLVVSPNGIFVIETKNYLGLVYGNATDYYIRRKVLLKCYKTYNPAKQNERHIDYLIKNLPITGSKLKALNSIIVFAAFTRLRLSDNPGNIGTLHQLPYMLTRYSHPSILSEKECNLIIEELRSYNRRY